MCPRQSFNFRSVVIFAVSLAFTQAVTFESQASEVAGTACENKQNSPLDAAELSKILEISKSLMAAGPYGGDIAKFCEDTTKVGQFANFTGGNSHTGETRIFRSDKEMDKAVSEGFTMYEKTPWVGSIYPDRRVRERSLQNVTLFAGGINAWLEIYGMDGTRKYLADPNSSARYKFNEADAQKNWEKIDQNSEMLADYLR